MKTIEVVFHVMFCQIDSNQRIVNTEVEYSNVSSNDVKKQLQISTIIAEIFSKRKDKLRKVEEVKKKNSLVRVNRVNHNNYVCCVH